MSSPVAVSRRAFWLDLLSKLVCVAALGLLTRRTWAHFQLYPSDTRLILLLLAESLTIFLVVIARASDRVMRKPMILTVTVVSSCYFLLLDLTGGLALVPYLYGRALQVLGIGVELVSKFWIGRSFGLLPANRGIVTSGPYRLVRHPMYLGYFLSGLGFLVCTMSWRNLVLYSVLWLLIYYRILKEEEFLLQDSAYVEYVKRVRHRILPFLL